MLEGFYISNKIELIVGYSEDGLDVIFSQNITPLIILYIKYHSFIISDLMCNQPYSY